MNSVLEVSAHGSLTRIAQGETTTFRFTKDQDHSSSNLVMIVSAVFGDLLSTDEIGLMAQRFQNAKLTLKLECDPETIDFNGELQTT